MNRLLGLFIIASIWLIGIRGGYIGELLISFLPYIIVFWLIFWLIAIYRLIRTRTRIRGIIFIGLTGVLGRGVGQILSYAESMPEVDEASGFSILYANIFVENRSYDALETVVREYDADVMALVEFGRHHRYALESLFGDLGYIHTNRVNRESVYDSNLLATRYDIQQVITYRLDDYINIESQEITYGGRQYMMHVVHLISPISEVYFLQRNKQLGALAHLMNQAIQDYPDHIHVLMGDFNVSPWSIYFQQFDDQLDEGWTNTTASQPLLMTWTAPYVSVMRSMIDYVWIYGQDDFSIQVVDVPGSDHKGLFLWLS